MRTVDGVALPFFFEFFGASIEITSAFLQLNADGTYTASVTANTTTEGSTETATETTTGTWVQQGNQVTFTYLSEPFNEESTETAVVSGSELVMIDEGVVFTYSR